MADTTRNIFTLGEYRDDQTAGKGVSVADVWTDLFPTGAVEIDINTQTNNRMDLGNTSQGSYIYVKQPAAATSEWDLGTGDWSFECWCKAKSIYTAGHYKRIWELGWNTSNSLCLNVRMDGTLEFRYNDTPYLNSSAGAFTIGEWHHVLVHRVSGSIRLFLDGVWQQTESLSGNLNYMTGSAISKLIIGANNGQPTTSWWNGWISNFRFLKGSASHTSSSNFVPPIPPLQNITNTKVLCCQDPDDPAGWTVVPVNYSGDQEINLYGLQQSGSNANQVGTQTASLQYVGLAKRWLGDKTETSNIGYAFGGGPSQFTNMMRLDMSTNTTSFFPGSENSYSSRMNHAATASQTTGYVAGGEPSTNAVGQFNFSNETSSGSSPMTLAGPRYGSVGHGNITHGYILGGGPGSPGYTNTTKLDYAANTSSNLPSSANLRASVPGSDQYTVDMNNTGNQEKGYTIGGNPGSSYIDKFIYATDTVSSSVSTVIPAGEPSSRRKPAYAAKGTALADGTYGYMIGNAFTNDGPAYQNKGSWFRITFASDTETFMPGWSPGSFGGSNGAKFGNTTKGYTMGGGGPGNGTNATNAVWEFDYATGTGTGVPGTLPASVNQNTGMSVRNSNAPVYFPPTVSTTPSVKLVDADYGIYQARDKSTFDKRDFSTDGVSLIPSLAFPSSSPSYTAAVANQDAIWAYTGGRGGYKVPWANQTRVTQPNSWFPEDHWYLLGSGNDAFNDSKSGYFAGGNSGVFNPAGYYAYTSEVYKIDFSTGTGYTPGRNRGERNAWGGNAQSDVQGYSFGGENNPSPGYHNKVYRMRFSDENWSELPSTGFPSHQSSMNSATGNKTHAYVGGGRNPSQSRSWIWKMSFSTDTGSRLPSSNLSGSGSSAWEGLSATGDQEKGYWAGGGPSQNGSGKLVYATDTMSGTAQYNNRQSNSYAISNAEMSRSGKIGTPIYMQ
jgi:hypothetical protein